MFSHGRAVLAWVAGQVPTVLVLAALVALGFWGHHYDWKLPEHWRSKPKEEESAKKEEDKEKEGEGISPGPVVLASDDAASLAGVETGPSRQETVSQEIDAPAVLAFDQTRYAQLAPRVPGNAWRVLHSVGDQVRKGEVLAVLSSPEAGRLRGEFLTAYVQHEIRAETLAKTKAAAHTLPDRQLREARLMLREARVKLLNDQQALGNIGLVIHLDDLRGLSDDQVARKVRLLGLPESVAKEPDLPGNLLPLVAPFDGVIVRRDLVIGEMADPARPCFILADTRRLWLDMDIRQEDAARLSLGQDFIFTARATRQTATGTLHWISAEVDAKTRTVRASADVYNPTGQLRPGTFGRARIGLQRQPAVTVPTAALQWDGKSHRVFIRRDEKTFEPLLVLPGARQGGRTQILDPRPVQFAGLASFLAAPAGPWQALAGWRAGDAILVPLRPGTSVATAGSHVIKSEMQKSRIGGED
jgi:cobalt-zinc-cadmium efflux system membrane fusion protein